MTNGVQYKVQRLYLTWPLRSHKWKYIQRKHGHNGLVDHFFNTEEAARERVSDILYSEWHEKEKRHALLLLLYYFP